MKIKENVDYVKLAKVTFIVRSAKFACAWVMLETALWNIIRNKYQRYIG